MSIDFDPYNEEYDRERYDYDWESGTVIDRSTGKEYDENGYEIQRD